MEKNMRKCMCEYGIKTLSKLTGKVKEKMIYAMYDHHSMLNIYSLRSKL